MDDIKNYCKDPTKKNFMKLNEKNRKTFFDIATRIKSKEDFINKTISYYNTPEISPDKKKVGGANRSAWDWRLDYYP